MSAHFDRFLTEALTDDRETDGGLDQEELYGLYTSWCLLQGLKPKPDTSFRKGMRMCRINVHGGRLRMKGRAAADYILTSYPRAA